MSPSSEVKNSLERFLEILSEFQHDLVTLAIPRNSTRLTLSQYLLLGGLWDVKKPVSIAVVASLMETTIPLVKILLDRLVAMGCVNRRGSNLYYITRAGLREYEVIHRQQTAQADAILTRLTDEERTMGTAICEKVLDQRMQEKLPSDFQIKKAA